MLYSLCVSVNKAILCLKKKQKQNPSLLPFNLRRNTIDPVDEFPSSETSSKERDQAGAALRISPLVAGMAGAAPSGESDQPDFQ